MRVLKRIDNPREVFNSENDSLLDFDRVLETPSDATSGIMYVKKYEDRGVAQVCYIGYLDHDETFINLMEISFMMPEYRKKVIKYFYKTKTRLSTVKQCVNLLDDQDNIEDAIFIIVKGKGRGRRRRSPLGYLASEFISMARLGLVKRRASLRRGDELDSSFVGKLSARSVGKLMRR